LNNERTPDGHRHYYLFDGLGSIVGLTKGDGTKENSYDDDPDGNMLHQTEGVTNPWKFAGGFLDSSTGLYKFGTRYDDPTLGRWTQQDPVGGSWRISMPPIGIPMLAMRLSDHRSTTITTTTIRTPTRKLFIHCPFV